ncbi:MAG: DEAD/DEAH box helicase [Candidatus Kaiserbacteria bacterium]|nr:DEAD/DEAH box helicase [Candidatus Kaiserbacteria bacterium]
MCEELNILNIGYLVKERAGLPTYGEKRFIKTLEQTDDAILVPRGFLKNLYEWLDAHSIMYRVIDERLTLDSIEFSTAYDLFPYQATAVAAFESSEQGILVAPAGAGKTLIGLDIIARKKQPAIILTHRRQIYDQWLERVEHGFGIPKRKIGQIGSTKKKLLQPVTVAMVQTLARMSDVSTIASEFGTVLIDECHHMPSHMFRDVVAKFPARYRFGLTATPSRKYNDEKLIGAYLGEVVHTIDKSEIESNYMQTNEQSADEDAVIVRTTNVATPFGTTSRDFQLISKVLSSDATRNALIAQDVAQEAHKNKKCLILTERKEHAEMLRAYLRKDFETVLFSGDLSGHKRTLALQKIKSGRFQILIATGQILGEGTDIAGLDVLFLAFPLSFHGKLAQYVGRIRREGGPKKVYDYRDAQVPVLEKQWKRRAAFYRKHNFTFTENSALVAEAKLI